MKKIVYILTLLFLPGPSLVAMEGELAGSLQAGREQEIVETLLDTLPPEVQYNIVEKLIENIKDKNSFEEALKAIASLEQVSKEFATLIQDEQHKDFLKKKLDNQIKEYKIEANLLDAVTFNSPLLVELLIKNKADVNVITSFSSTPLHLAVSKRAINIAELLIAANANINAKNIAGRTPLHLAAMHDLKEFTELLIAKKADAYAQDNQRRIPLDYAETLEMKQLLQDAMKKQSARN